MNFFRNLNGVEFTYAMFTLFAILASLGFIFFS
jgi:hypothetical protein